MRAAEETQGGVTAKAVVIGLVFVLIECLLVHYVDQVIHGTLTFHLVPAPALIVLLFLLVWGVNIPLRLLAPRRALTTREILVVYTMMGVGLTAPSMGMAQVLVPALAAPAYYASPSNKFAEIFQLGTDMVIPRWLAPTDYDSIKGLFSRVSTEPIDWAMVVRTWALPLTLWGAWMFVLYFVYICLMAVLRKPWVEREQLTFAYNVIPEHMSASPPVDAPGAIPPFWKSKWMWAGFAIPFTYHFFANLYVISPVFPVVPFFYDLAPYFTEFPWNGIGELKIWISLHAVAFSMLLTEEMLFSLWFFFAVNKVLAIVFYAFGWNETYSYFESPAMSNQGTGAFLAYFLIVLWAMRSHLRVVASRAIRLRVGADEANEPLTYRAAFWGGILGMGALVGFCGAAGANPFWSFLVLIMILAYWVVLTRLVAEAGIFMSQAPTATVHDTIAKVFGSAALSIPTWTVLGFFKSIFLKWYTIMPAYVLGGFKFADRHRINARRLVAAMLLAIALSIVAGFCTTVWMNYEYGALNLSVWKAESLAKQPFDCVRAYYESPNKPDWKSMSVMGVGAIVTLFLSIMRMNFVWWPFHPLGYVASNLYIIHYFWIHIFIAWALSRLITKYGGLTLMRKIRPFLIGVVIGALMSGGFWWIIDYAYCLDTHWVYAI